MTADTKRGTIWQDYENDAIVSDYFAMLGSELSGKPYVKARHSAALMALIGRSHRSVEFKHGNISAALDALGMPWIPGYRPRLNYQNAIFDAIDRYLSRNRAMLESQPVEQPIPLASEEIFVSPPIPRETEGRMPDRLRQLVAKFDPVERDYRNRALGLAGEGFVVDLERRMLTGANRADLARKVRWTSQEDGDGAGYDVQSFTASGRDRLIEVKTTNGSARTPFFLTRNEFEVATERRDAWQIYRVHLFSRGPRVFTISPPLETALKLSAETWRASF